MMRSMDYGAPLLECGQSPLLIVIISALLNAQEIFVIIILNFLSTRLSSLRAVTGWI